MELPPQEDAIIEGFSADSSRFTTAGFGEPVRIWNAGDGSLQATLQESQFLPGTVRFSPDGVWVLVSGVGNTNTKLWDSETGRFVYSFGGKAQVGEAEFSPTGREIVTASTDGELDIWDLRLERRRPEWILNQIRTMTSWELKGNLVYQKKNQPVPLER
jgi:WD40 repeat protein